MSSGSGFNFIKPAPDNFDLWITVLVMMVLYFILLDQDPELNAVILILEDRDLLRYKHTHARAHTHKSSCCLWTGGRVTEWLQSAGLWPSSYFWHSTNTCSSILIFLIYQVGDSATHLAPVMTMWNKMFQVWWSQVSVRIVVMNLIICLIQVRISITSTESIYYFVVLALFLDCLISCCIFPLLQDTIG